METSKRKKLSTPSMSVFTLVMINIIAIDNLRGIPMGAHYGFSLVFYYIIASIAFFIPSALVSAELATAWPQTGGIYIWVREAFGIPFGFLVSWIQWIYNICWYPTVLSLLAATLAYMFNPSLANNTWYMLSVIFSSYWILTLVTLRGMRISGTISSITAFFGTLLPMLIITILGVVWMGMGKPVNISFSLNAFTPSIKDPTNIALLTGIFYTLVGMEMSASHAQDVKNPQQNYPKALLYSTIIILLSLVLSSLAIAIVLPTQQLNILTGLLDAFKTFFSVFGLGWISPIISVLIIVGVIGGVGAWMIGPTRGLLVAAQDGCLPPLLQKINKKHMPIALLITQGVIFSMVCFVFLVMPSISSSFWILSDLTAQLAMSCYLFLFSAAIYLRYKHPHKHRSFKIPFGKFGLWTTCILGIIASLFTIMIGYFPPSQVYVGHLFFYETFLVIGFIVFYAIPLLIYAFRKRKWKTTLMEETIEIID